MSSFENLRIVDNFYQTSLYYPMPTVVISTLAEDGSTSLGPYSLIAPYYVAGAGEEPDHGGKPGRCASDGDLQRDPGP